MNTQGIHIIDQKEQISAYPESNQHDCKYILDSYEISYTEETPYLQVGKTPSNISWVIYVSVIRIQFSLLLKIIIPFLLEEHLAFKIPSTKEVVRNLLDGSMGLEQLGKVICIYPKQTDNFLSLAQRLVSLCGDFRGPAIPTARTLGGCIYTQYESLVHTGTAKEITSWPFEELMPFKTQTPGPLFNYRYKPLAVIKPDLKGRVIQANYFKSLFNIKLCIIKEGVKNMWTDELGRDIVDRLKWQYELYMDLADRVPTPKIFDIFEERGNTYLTMEFITGDALSEKVYSLYGGRSWFELYTTQKLLLIEYFLKITALIVKLHESGYVHRDITPSNFIVDKRGQFFLIDMELSYSIQKQKPSPPFKQGTPGYMSHEQMIRLTPTVKEDIYALGALMIFVFTGISPSKIETRPNGNLLKHLSFFTESPQLISLIQLCLSNKPEDRPILSIIIDTLERYQTDLKTSPSRKQIDLKTSAHDSQSENALINLAIRAFNSEEVTDENNVWAFQKEEEGLVGMQSAERIPLSNLSRGIAGILFILARASRSGHDMTSLLPIYYHNWEYLKSQNFVTTSTIGHGLFNGMPGLALAIHEGINAGLLTNNDIDLLQICFENDDCPYYDLANGIAGQGLAMLRCQDNLNIEFRQLYLSQRVEALLSSQQKDGSWNTFRNNGRRNDKTIGLINGTVGIICFMINYARQYHDEHVITSIHNGLRWLIKQANKNKNQYSWTISTKSKSIDTNSTAIGIPGIALSFIRAYELLNAPLYLTVAENVLHQLPRQPISIDLTQLNGLSGLGEVYQEAYRVFKSSEWQERVNWITGVFNHTLLSDKKIPGYWSMNAFQNFEGGLMTGCAGIIHFLMRTQEENNIGHLLLGN